MPNMRIPGTYAEPSLEVGYLTHLGSLVILLSLRAAWRFLEQQPREPALRQSQQEQQRD